MGVRPVQNEAMGILLVNLTADTDADLAVDLTAAGYTVQFASSIGQIIENLTIGGYHFVVLVRQIRGAFTYTLLPVDRMTPEFMEWLLPGENHRPVANCQPQHSFIGPTAKSGLLSELKSMSVQNRQPGVRLGLKAGDPFEMLWSALLAKDPYTAHHGERVGFLAARTAEIMGLSKADVLFAEQAGRLHDIGKILLDEKALNKPGPLTQDEYEDMKAHPLHGESIIEPIPALADLIPIVGGHHEWVNGGGYPRGLKGSKISAITRIVSVADAYDAMTTDRPYRQAQSSREALVELQRCAGIQFDAAVVDAFEILIDEIDASKGRIAIA